MAHLKYFGLKNFRVFDEEEGVFLNLAPISLITGTNNSGKSSFLKALVMLRDSIVAGNGQHGSFNIDLNKQEHFLGDINNIFHNKTKKSVEISVPFPFLGVKSLVLTLVFKTKSKNSTYNADLKEVIVKDQNEPNQCPLFRFSYREASKAEQEQAKVVYTEKYERKKAEYQQEVKEAKKAGKKTWFTAPYILHQTLPNRYQLVAYIEKEINTSLLSKYLHELHQIYDHFIKELGAPFNDDDLRYWKSHKELKKLNYDILAFSAEFGWKLDLTKWTTQINKLKKIASLNDPIAVTDEAFYSDYEEGPPPTEGDVLYDKILTNLESLSWTDEIKKDESIKVLRQSFKNTWKKLFSKVTLITHTPSVRGLSSRIYDENSNNIFVKLLKEHLPYSGYNDFISKWLTEFNIGKRFDIKHIPKFGLLEASIITFDNQKRPLVDFGYGIMQLVTILIQIDVLANKNAGEEYWYDQDGEYRKTVYQPSILIIEEPETNLHPNWQSKLADLFLQASTKLNIQLIVETHSEYLIRRFQYLVAKEKLDSEMIKLFYVYKNKTVDNRKIEEIKIESNGNIDFSKFGEGFFDVSLDLITSLWDAQISKTLSNEEKTILKDLSTSYKEIIALQQKLAKIQTDKENDNSKALKVINEKVTTIQSTTHNTQQLVEKIDENIIIILKGFQDFSKGLKTIKEVLNSIQLEETKRFERLHAFFDKFWAENATDIHDYNQYIEDWLTSWEKLDPRSHIFLLHAELATRSLKECNALDYSLSILQYCRILERELSVQIFNPFKDFLIKKYWKEQSSSDYDILFTNLENKLSTSPKPTNLDDLKRLWSLAKNLKADTSKTHEVALNTPKAVMLGQSIDGLYLLNETSINMEPLILELSQFINDNLNWNNVVNFTIPPDITQSMFSGVQGISFIDCIEELRKNYRNKASHTSTLDEKAMDNTKKSVELLLQFWTEELLK